MQQPLLEIDNLKTFFYTHYGVIRAVDDVSLRVDNGEALGVVGESGCGKSVLARSIMRLIPNPPGRIVNGSIRLNGRDLLNISSRKMQKIRGNEISMIFQEPMTALNPIYTIGYQLAEIYRKHRRLKKREALAQSVDMLRTVGIPSPENRIGEYPFQMSGGMCQRVIIAMALACRPKLILADEPTTALDVTIQAQILDIIRDMQDEFKTAMILITHDLAVIAETVSRVLVMYAGQLVEQSDVKDLFNDPLHPYTQGLMDSMPDIDNTQSKDSALLNEIPGIVPDLCRLPQGCYFHPRCNQRRAKCETEPPRFVRMGSDRWVRCWNYA